MPRVCAQLAELTAQHAADATQLARLIQSDAALAGETTRVANSPALRPRSPMSEAYRIAAFDVLKQRSLPQPVQLNVAAAARAARL